MLCCSALSSGNPSRSGRVLVALEQDNEVCHAAGRSDCLLTSSLSCAAGSWAGSSSICTATPMQPQTHPTWLPLLHGETCLVACRWRPSRS